MEIKLVIDSMALIYNDLVCLSHTKNCVNKNEGGIYAENLKPNRQEEALLLVIAPLSQTQMTIFTLCYSYRQIHITCRNAHK